MPCFDHQHNLGHQSLLQFSSYDYRRSRASVQPESRSRSRIFSRCSRVSLRGCRQGLANICAPPAECALHPLEDPDSKSDRQLQHGGRHLLGAVLYLMCDDVRAQIKLLKLKNVTCTEVEEEPWGIKTTFQLPSGGEIGLYQPIHLSPLELPKAKQ